MSYHLHNHSLHRQSQNGFTLIELLAVVVVVLILAAIVTGLANYANSRVTTARAQAEIAAMGMVIESYHADHGIYPQSTAVRISRTGDLEKYNGYLLYRATSNYLKGAKFNLQVGRVVSNFTGNSGCFTNNDTFSNVFVDPWGRPYNYYNYATSFRLLYDCSNMWYAAEGGQMNTTTYDLFTPGPDRQTYVPGASVPGSIGAMWNSKQSTVDDITNWKR